MKKYFISAVVLVTLLMGCKSSGGVCCDAEGDEIPEEEQELLLAPVAVFDNRTVTDQSAYSFLALSGDGSYDRDESNTSIKKWDWSITSYDQNNEIILIDDDCTKVANTTDVNVTYDNCQNAVYTIVRLTVTDDENQTDTAEKNISVPL